MGQRISGTLNPHEEYALDNPCLMHDLEYFTLLNLSEFRMRYPVPTTAEGGTGPGNILPALPFVLRLLEQIHGHIDEIKERRPVWDMVGR